MSETIGKVPPSSLEIERAVLGAAMLEDEGCKAACGLLSEDVFYFRANGAIFKAIKSLCNKKYPVDILTVVQELKVNKELDNVGGAYEVTQLMSTVASAGNIETHCRILLQLFFKRELIKLSTSLNKQSYDDFSDPFDIMDALKKKLKGIESHIVTNKISDNNEIIDTVLINIEEASKNNGVTGYSTGIKSLDMGLMGLRPQLKYVIAALPGEGKCFGKGTKILMHDCSTKNVEDVKIGDLLMGNDSTPRTVLGITNGTEQMYWIRQNSGIDYRVNESHILALRKSKNDSAGKNGDLLNISVRDILQKPKTFITQWKGYKTELSFQEKNLLIDPYFLGLWLGDGTASKPSITNPDKEIIDYIEKFANNIGLQVTKNINSSGCPTLDITKGYRGSEYEYCLIHDLRQINVLNNKHIPDNYLYNSKKNRLQILAGLLDTDGYLMNGNTYEIVQKRKILSDQIVFLAQSLGFKVSQIEKIGTIKSINFSGKYYKVNISGNIEIIPLKVSRKKLVKLNPNKNHLATGLTIEKDIIDNYYGFEIDGNKLFCLSDTTVVHNSALLQTIIVNLTNTQGIPGVVFSLEVPKEMFMMGCISKILNIPNHLIQTGQLTALEKHTIKCLKDSLFAKTLIIDDRGGIGPAEMWPTLRKLKESHGIKWFGVDYLGIEKLRGLEHRGKNEEQILNYITAEHKIMCKELDLVGFELAQFTKETRKRDGSRPKIGDLKGSSGIEANADSIILIYRPELHGVYEYKGISDTHGFAELSIVKSRFGSLKDLITKFEGHYTKFSNHESGNEFVPNNHF